MLWRIPSPHTPSINTSNKCTCAWYDTYFLFSNLLSAECYAMPGPRVRPLPRRQMRPPLPAPVAICLLLSSLVPLAAATLPPPQAAPAATVVAPPPLRMTVALYSPPGPAWSRMAASATAHPSVKMTALISPNHGTSDQRRCCQSPLALPAPSLHGTRHGSHDAANT